MRLFSLGLALALAASAFGASEIRDGSPKLAEVVVDRGLLEQFAFVQSMRQPFDSDGSTLFPDVTVTARAGLKTHSSSALAILNVNVGGAINTSQTQSVGRRGRRQVTVNVTTQLQGDYRQELFIDKKGLRPGTITGSPTVTPSISTSNNFRLPRINSLVNGIAYEKASEMVGAKIPGARAQLNGEVTGGIRGAADQAAVAIEKVFAKAQSALPAEVPNRIETRFSSRSEGSGEIKAELRDRAGGNHRGVEPKLELADQAATKARVHEDLFATSIGPELAGKEMTLGELGKKLCGARTPSLLDFCRRDLPEIVKKTVVLFDKQKPIETRFRTGKIILRLNAAYRIGPMETAPYSVEAIYGLEPESASLQSVTVRERGGAALPILSLSLPGGDHADASMGPTRALAAWGLSALQKTGLQHDFEKLFKPRLPFTSFSFPTQVSSGDTYAPTMLEAGTLFPLELKAENGWLLFTTAYCSEKMAPLGVSLEPAEGESGLRVTEVSAYTPAWNNYFQAGDRIESFGEPGKRLTTLVGNTQPFFDFIQQHANGANALSRTVELVGKEASGKPFRRLVSLCPRNVDHRGQAQRLLDSVLGTGGNQ